MTVGAVFVGGIMVGLIVLLGWIWYEIDSAPHSGPRDWMP